MNIAGDNFQECPSTFGRKEKNCTLCIAMVLQTNKSSIISLPQSSKHCAFITYGVHMLLAWLCSDACHLQSQVYCLALSRSSDQTNVHLLARQSGAHIITLHRVPTHPIPTHPIIALEQKEVLQDNLKV